MAKIKTKGVSVQECLSVRVPPEVKTEFLDLCETYGVKWPDLMREIIGALIDDRLTIDVSKDQRRLITGLHNPIL
jgi:hypothetical protein